MFRQAIQNTKYSVYKLDDMALVPIKIIDLGKRIYDKSTPSMLNHLNVSRSTTCTIRKWIETITKFSVLNRTYFFM
jgi:hypothetical protein